MNKSEREKLRFLLEKSIILDLSHINTYIPEILDALTRFFEVLDQIDRLEDECHHLRTQLEELQADFNAVMTANEGLAEKAERYGNKLMMHNLI